jgi:hypothetical protein
MARKTKQDVAKAKAAKQKKIAIGGSILLVVLLAYEVPKTMKMMSAHPAPPVTSSTTPAPTSTDGTSTTTDPSSLAAPTLGTLPTTTTPTATTSSAALVSAVPLAVDSGQLRTFQQFATKDPFQAQVPAGSGSGSGSGGGSSGGAKAGAGSSSGAGSGGGAAPPPATTVPSAPAGSPAPTPAPTSAVISVNGELTSVSVGGDFPSSGATFARAGAIFHLVSLTQRTAKVAIAGGSYANGAPTVALRLKVPLTLQNTADGSKYTLILEPQGTQVTAATPATTTTTTTAAPAAGASAVPSGGSGG